ncbi:transcriptional regulator [Paenibacillus sp. CCS19]|uniref:ArsR/SmtB family transcription factor n=1 Tax=Paenibacillus sp. CCS19 TaxID=3158387 RepID=UPI00256548D6|nr:ArsR family transcriptional regulator [Paenibacillus cellulosilyticus]GMK39989.1 transcriptional regulator [Paenibacillus cellulosilyticus]
MEIIISEDNLPVFEALSSPVRIKIIELLTQQPMIMKDLAAAVSLSNSIITMHVKKLEKAGIIHIEMIPGKGGGQKLCSLSTDRIDIAFPIKGSARMNQHTSSVMVGHYTDFDVKPTCGLATKQGLVGGSFDEPRYFLNAERVDAKILWFSQGFIEYKVPNYLMDNEIPEELDISMELASEAPLTNDNWPSDISFYLNDVKIGMWTSPGDFGGTRGRYTPEWWGLHINQYGLLVRIKITHAGTFIDGLKVSDVTIDDIAIRSLQWKFRLAVEEDAVNVGGLTIYGSGFGNYYQDIAFKLYYRT